MQSILSALRGGTGKERLAIVSDLVSIVGVSIASIAGGIFALTAGTGTANLNFNQIGTATVIGLLSLAGAVLLLALFLVIFSWINNWQPKVAGVRALVLTSVWLALFALIIVAMFAYYELFSSFRFVRTT
jgi:sterol desaturase/sphingolipid hydroxylase (fatty acid hydroxylase superfamily)